MATKKTQTKAPKVDALRARSCLNPRPEAVTDPLFSGSDFFDARDVLQVKYEMLRRVHVDGQPISKCASAFGLSRPTFYQARAAFEHGGLPALLPKKPGPRRSHKLSIEVVRYLEQLLDADPSLRAVELCERARERFGIEVHPRSIERALARQKKKTSVIGFATPGSKHLAADYEALRSGVLETQRSGAPLGLVILLREGLAAWMAHAHAPPVTITRATWSERSTAARAVSDDLRTAMVAVLASMVIAAPEGRTA